MENVTNGEVPPESHDELRHALMLIAGKWKLEILWLLHHRIHRFGELKRSIPRMSQHMLTLQLRELERSEEHPSELQSLMRSSYAVFGLNKKKMTKKKYLSSDMLIITHITEII